MRNHCDHCCINTSRKLSDLLWAVKPCGKEQLGELTWCLSLIEKNASHVWLHSCRKAQVWRHCLRSWCGWTSSLPDHLLPQCPFITSFGWVASSCQALHTHTHIKILSPLPFSPSELTAAELISQNKEHSNYIPYLYIMWHFDKAQFPALLSLVCDPRLNPLKGHSYTTQLHCSV